MQAGQIREIAIQKSKASGRCQPPDVFESPKVLQIMGLTSHARRFDYAENAPRVPVLLAKESTGTSKCLSIVKNKLDNGGFWGRAL